MECRRCGSQLDRPGDYCLTCHTGNVESVIIDIARGRAVLTMVGQGTGVLGETTITTIPEDGEEERAELRNFAGRIADEVRRKRPDAVYVTGDRAVVQRLQRELHYSLSRVPEENPVAAVTNEDEGRSLEVVETEPDEKIGGAHSTLIGGRAGEELLREIAGHAHVKKIIPGPIESGGSGTDRGVTAKATRADRNGNVRVLLRDGSSVQENRIVTTAKDREAGERVRGELNEALTLAQIDE
jgi:hypothetical protein